LAALVLLGHGVGHLMGFMESWTSINVGFTDKPWIFGGKYMMDSTVGKTFGILWLVALALFVGSAFGVLTGDTWWRTLAIIGSVVSLVGIIPWWNTVMLGVKAGALLDVAILLVLLFSQGEPITRFFDVP
jgi:hypothetical protein